MEVQSQAVNLAVARGPMMDGPMGHLCRKAQWLMARGEDPTRALEDLRPRMMTQNPYSGATSLIDQWKEIDPVVQETWKANMPLANDLGSRGLVYALPDGGFGTMVVEWQDSSDITAADVSMDTTTPPTLDRVAYATRGVCVPVHAKGFQMGQRFNAMAPQVSADNVMGCTVSVAYSIDGMIMNGLSNISHGGYSVYGYTTHASRNTGSLNAAWSTATPGQKVDDIERIVGACMDDYASGPIRVYIPSGWERYMLGDYYSEVGASPTTSHVVEGSKPLSQRLREIPRVEDIVPTPHLTAAIVGVCMDRRSVDLVRGFEPTAVSWDSDGGFARQTRVLSIMSVRVKRDYNGRSGVVHFT